MGSLDLEGSKIINGFDFACNQAIHELPAIIPDLWQKKGYPLFETG
jgi:hypothetical protein